MRWRYAAVCLVCACFQDGPPSVDDADGGSTAAEDDDDVTSSTAAMSTTTSDVSSSTSDESTATGEPPPSCGPASDCVTAPPEGWRGPTLVTIAPGNAEPSPCPPGFASDLLLSHAPPPGAAQCSCTCEDPHDVECNAIVTIATSDVVSGSCAAGTNASSSVGECVAAPDAWSVVELTSATSVQGNSGSCDAVATQMVPPVEVVETFRVCGDGPGAEACDSDGICVPTLPDLGYRRCIVREGDHDCPAEWNDPLPLAFETLVDDRGCAPCICGEPQTLCTPYLEVHLDGSCSNLVEVLGEGECTNDVSVQSVQTAYAIGGECMPSSARPVGGFEPQGPTTVCCLP
jgi:hypothetical protein